MRLSASATGQAYQARLRGVGVPRQCRRRGLVIVPPSFRTASAVAHPPGILVAVLSSLVVECCPGTHDVYHHGPPMRISNLSLYTHARRSWLPGGRASSGT